MLHLILILGYRYFLTIQEKTKKSGDKLFIKDPIKLIHRLPSGEFVKKYWWLATVHNVRTRLLGLSRDIFIPEINY